MCVCACLYALIHVCLCVYMHVATGRLLLGNWMDPYLIVQIPYGHFFSKALNLTYFTVFLLVMKIKSSNV